MDEDGSFYFLEMNTRLQVEHTVTEMVTGYDLVGAADPGRDGREARRWTRRRAARAIQCRINAEDPGRNFLPGPGRITRYEEPSGPFVRVDSGVTAGREIPGDYDSMFAKLIVSGGGPGARPQADAPRARRVPDRGRARRRSRSTVDLGVRRSSATPRIRPPGSSARSRDVDLPSQVDLQSAPAGPSPARPADILVEVDGRRVPVRIFDERRDAGAALAGHARAHHGEHVHGEIRAPMQGTILKVLVEKGQEIRAGDVVCILEAMKMENHIASTREGEVTELPIRAGQVVETGQTLAVID